MSLDDPFERVSWIRQPQSDGWEYLVARRSRHLWSFFHESYDVCALRHSGVTWYYRGRVAAADKAGTMLLQPGETHRTLATRPTGVEFVVACIAPETVTAAAEELGSSGPPHLVGAYTADPRLTQALWQLAAFVEEGLPDPLQLQSMQAGVLRLLLEHSERPPRALSGHDSRISTAAQFLRAHFTESVSLDQLAAVAKMSRFMLVRAFSRRYGVPPHAFQLHLRIARARELLAKGVPAGLVAAEVGFCDQSHLTRHFKRLTRVTPKQYSRGAGVQL